VRWFLGLIGSTAVSLAFVFACSSSPPAPSGPTGQILPIVSGHKWTFTAKPTSDAGLDCTGDQTAEVDGPGGKYDGGSSLRYKSVCLDPSIQAVDIQGTGDRLVGYVLDADGGGLKTTVLYLDQPVADGHQWDYSSKDKYEWTKNGDETVPAGKFSDCWKRHRIQPTSDNYEIFCRGVGQVKYHTSDWDAELKSKNF
jgi:hypothetical protein